MAAAAASAAASAASRYSGRYALHPLMAGAAQSISEVCNGRLKPSWTHQAQSLLSKWQKLAFCLPRYSAFLAKTNRKDLKRAHVFMNEEAQAALGEFYLCCALRMRPEEVENAGQDSAKLLALANTVATQDVEPFFQECRNFVSGYDEAFHKRLDETTIWREVEDGLFWHHSFEVAAPEAYLAFRRASLPPEEQWPARDDEAAVAVLLDSCCAVLVKEGLARSKAEETYQAFLEASATPVKGSIRSALIDHGIMWGHVQYRSQQESLNPVS